jgi:HK97 family phage major capsid protein
MSAELNEVKDLIGKIGHGHEEMKKAQDALDSKLEKGEAGQAELKEKLDRIDESMNEALEMKKNLEETMATVRRMGGSHEDNLENNDVDVKSYSSAMKKWLAKGLPMDVKGLDLNEKEEKALQSNIDPQGGYTVMPFIGDIEKRLFDTSPVRSLASVSTIDTNEYVGYHDDNEFGAGWIGEIDTRSETSTADIGEFRIPVREMYARFTISDRLLEDSSWNMEQWATGDVVDKFARLEATAFVNGNGPNQPEGLMTATQNTATPNGYVRGQIGTLQTAGATAITTDELVTLRGYLKQGYRSNATFLFNRSTEAYVRKLKDGQGNYIWQPSYQAGEADTLIGQKVSIWEDMPDIATGVIAVALSDVRDSYKIVDRVGVSILRDVYTQSANGRIVFHMRKRVGSGLTSFDSTKYLLQA